MADVRLRRLQSDYNAMRQLVHLNPRIQVESVSGNPPTLYRLGVRVRSLREQRENLEEIEEHRVEVRLPLGYPKNAPVCRMLTPVFHPNIAPHAICIGDHWSAGESLDALVLRICEMLAFQSYNVKSPLNGLAAKWVEEHLERLPLDATPFLSVGEVETAEKPSNGVALACANCGQAVAPDEAERCEVGHALCGDCVVHCQTCNRVLCLVCGELQCKVCNLACANCGQLVPAKEAERCEVGHVLCGDCNMQCETCGRVLCLVCGETKCKVCQPETII